jgi:hypothetical protein
MPSIKYAVTNAPKHRALMTNSTIIIFNSEIVRRASIFSLVLDMFVSFFEDWCWMHPPVYQQRCW